MNLVRKRSAIAVLCAAMALFVVVLGFASHALAENADKNSSSAATSKLEISKPEELAGKKIGMVSAAVFDKLVKERVEGIKNDDILYFNNNAEAVGALQSKKIDAFISDAPINELVINQNEGLGIIPEPLQDDKYAYILPKGSPYTQELNERLKAYKADGTLEKLRKKWTGADESMKTMPEQKWNTPNGTLTVATSSDNAPINYESNGRTRGLCIELLEMVLRDMGYGVEYRSTTVGSILAEIQSGKVDIGANSFSLTEERKQMMDMTEPFYEGGVTVAVRIEGYEAGKNEGFFEGLAKSFERTFITENRWQLILEGLGVTMAVSVSSGALGLMLGFVLVLLRRKKEGGLADKLIHLLENLMGGLPVVVVLMVLYYVIFGAIDIPGMIVAILAFTLIFGASSGSIMWNAIRAVDTGQTEAGRALGFGDKDTFFLIVLPQAAKQFAPILVGQFIGLVKDTSIVGYIAVQDLTRVGDIIRARTMEAFFPLIAIAVIYFALCRLMAWLLNKFIVRRLDPKDGPRTIKGVEL